jgi:hypothetical protein
MHSTGWKSGNGEERDREFRDGNFITQEMIAIGNAGKQQGGPSVALLLICIMG